MAVILNAGIAAFCVLSLFVIWTSLIKKSRWAFWALLISIGLLHLFGFVSISFIEDRYLLATILSTAIVGIGFGLCGYAVQRRQ
jgi:hypothetical protein